MTTKSSKSEAESSLTDSARGANLGMVAQQSSPALDTLLVEQQNQQIQELNRLISNLSDQLTAAQAVSARDDLFVSAVQSVENAANAVQQGIALPYRAHEAKERDCAPCACVSNDCCTFEIWMSDVRADHMQLPIEPTDSNILPTSVMEIWMFATIDPVTNIGVCIPDASPLSYIPLHKQITEAFGPWHSVNRLVGTVSVKKGTSLTVPLKLVGVERETATDRALPLNRDEWGTGNDRVTLNCCNSDYSPIQITVQLTSWGQGGGTITGRFIIVKRC